MGGCERLTIDLAAEFDRRGRAQAVGLIAVDEGPVGREIRERGIALRLIPFPVPGDWQLAKSVAGLCRELRAGSVLTHAFGLHLPIAVGARMGGARRVLAFAGNPPSASVRSKIATAVRAQLARPFVSREIACSGYVKERMAKTYRLPAARIAVVPNWCDIESLAQRASAARAARPCTDGPVLGTVARLDPIKDHETVLRAFARVRNACPAALLRLVGDGPRCAALERLAVELNITEGVRFLGARDDVPEQLGACDLFVYATTEAEGFGIVLAEAMAAGVPVVCTDVGPCREVLGGGRGGRLVPPRDPKSMADAVLALWNDPNERVSLAENAGDLVREHYGVARAADRIQEFVDN